MKTILSPGRALFILLFAMITSLTSDAQIKRGDFFFEEFEYGLALEAYAFAYNEQHIMNPYLARKLALTHRKLGNMTESTEWYKKTLHRDKSNYIDLLYYAEGLKYKKDYKEAMKYYKKFNEEVPSDRRGILHLENPDYVSQLEADSAFYEIKRLGMNTDKPEFGICRYENGYLFSATGVINPEMGQAYYEGEELDNMYMDIYTATKGEENELKLGKKLEVAVNSEFHDGPTTYDHMNEQLFFTRNNVVKDKPVLDSKGNVNLKIYMSQRTGTGYAVAVELPFNSTEISNAHPSITADGKRLYFASNRAGGEGETDIYYVDRVGEGWGEPQNVGSEINTEGEETFPYIAENGDLYFSSTGHAGLGGTDIFRSKWKNGHWTKPRNLGAPVNSNKDDFGIVTEKDGFSGYFSSNRHSETTDDDIYHFSYDPEVSVRARVRDENSLNGLSTAVGKLFDTDGTLLMSQKADVDGYIDFSLIPEECDYLFEVSNGSDYSVVTLDLAHCDRRLKVYDFGNIDLAEMLYVARGTVRDTLTDQGIPNFECTLFNGESGEMIRKANTKNDGGVRFSLRPETDYRITFKKDGWFAKSAEFSTKGMDPGVIEIERYVDMTFEQIVVNKPVVVDDIFYDHDKFIIREDAKPALDKLVKMLEDNPTVDIELSSHTDSQGSDKYNIALSGSRAKSAAEYMIAMGIEIDRVITKGYGETRIRNKCKNGVQCSDKEHEYNRRTEFKVLRY